MNSHEHANPIFETPRAAAPGLESSPAQLLSASIGHDARGTYQLERVRFEARDPTFLLAAVKQ
jgi:hypothetical protein